MSASKAEALATTETRLDRRRPVLLGTILGPEPRALLKLPSGEVHTLSLGDKIGGAPLVAIEDGRIALRENGTARWLTIP